MTFIEPYEDPEMEPGFVRTERAFLKDKGIRTAKRELELQEKAAMSMMDTSIATKSVNDTLFRDVDRSSNIHSSGMSILNERAGSKDVPFFNKSMHHKTSAMTSRKRTYDVAASSASDRNSLYETYHKI